MSDPLVVESVGVGFGGVRALDAVDVVVGPAEIVSIVGPNGAGKTTLLNAVCGLVPISGGTVRHAGREIQRRDPASIAAGGIGRSFQAPPLLEDSTVVENILCGAHTTLNYTLLDQVLRRGKVRRAEAQWSARARDLLGLVGIRHLADTEVSELAYGTRKIVDILRATLPRPSLLLLDEPSSGLDTEERARVEELLMTIRSEYGIPMLVVEHHIELVRRVSDRVVALVSGSVALTGSAHEVLDSRKFHELIAGTLPAATATAATTTTSGEGP